MSNKNLPLFPSTSPSSNTNSLSNRRIFLKSLFGVGLVASHLDIFSSSLFAQDPSQAILPSENFDLIFNKRLTSFIFAGCRDQALPQDFWPFITERAPQMFLWNGDAIYADDASEFERASIYQKMMELPGYKKLLKEASILGTWDDHDYGTNNAGAEYKDKLGSKRAFLNFIGEKENSPRWQREGIYQSVLFNNENDRSQNISFYLLDLRTFKERPRNNAELLGKAQWKWFEERLRQDDSPVSFIVSSIQMLNPETNKETWESWPDDKEKMLELVQEMQEKFKKKIIILSGDRHWADASYHENVYEFTSSGLTHHTNNDRGNKYRQGPVFLEENFAQVDLSSPSGVQISFISAKDNRLLNNYLV